MKKALVILLALTMVMSMVAMIPMGASAAEEEELDVGAVAEGYKPEGTAINNAEEFAAMAADGKYYLAADIELNATYLENFTGTLDGNGKTITTSVPVFDQLNGTVMNLALKGYVEITEETGVNMAGALAIEAAFANDVNITNVANYATVTSKILGCAGFIGLVGQGMAKTCTTITNCVNYAAIEGGEQKADGSWQLIADNAGFVVCSVALGHDDLTGIKFVDCANYGDIGSNGRNAGIVSKTRGPAQFINCVNEGNIVSENMLAGGIVAGISLDVSDAKALGLGLNATGNARTEVSIYDTYLFDGCVNKGDVTAFGYDGNSGVGGIIGSSLLLNELIIKNCSNTGDVVHTSTKKAGSIGGIIGNTALNNANVKVYIENCTNKGNVGTAEHSAALVDNSTSGANLFRAGGIAGAVQGKDLIIKNNYNYGEVYGNLIAGGIVGAFGNVENGANALAIGNVNYGDIYGDTRVGGIAGNIAGGIAWGPTFMYNIVIGDVYGKYVTMGGVVGHAQNVSGLVAKYNIVAGKITCITGPNSTSKDYKLVEDGGSVSNAVHYYYVGANGENRYFIAPQKGTVAIDGDKVTFTADSKAAFPIAGTINNGDSIIQKKVSPYNNVYLYEADNGKTYAIWPRNFTAAPVEIDVTGAYPVASAGGFACDIIEWNVADDNRTVELVTANHPVIASAISWSITGRPIGWETNVVLEGCSETFIANAFANTWRAFEFVDNNTGWTMDDFTSGKVAYELNREIGEEIFRQNLRADLFEVDEFPTTDQAHAKVTIVDGDYWNVTFDPNDDLGSPETGDATIYVVIALAVSAIALAGFMVAKKVKEN